jgi:endonuclease III-like uncharacterized protein
VNYYAVLDAGMALETSEFGELSREEYVFSFIISYTFDQLYRRFQAQNEKFLHVYRRLRSGIPQFAQDFYKLQQSSEEFKALQKQVSTHIES